MVAQVQTACMSRPERYPFCSAWSINEFLAVLSMMGWDVEILHTVELWAPSLAHNQQPGDVLVEVSGTQRFSDVIPSLGSACLDDPQAKPVLLPSLNLPALPVGVLGIILSFLPLAAALRIALVSRHFHTAFMQESAWKRRAASLGQELQLSAAVSCYAAYRNWRIVSGGRMPVFARLCGYTQRELREIDWENF
jgi:hypothetical protein